MKRQRSYVDDLEDDRRRFYDRGPPPPPPRRRPAEYESDGFDRRKGFGPGFYDHRSRESPSPRGYGGDRAMHRSESFSGFRREFPKGSRSERDRSRRDGGGSSAWRRPGDGWRDSEGLDGHRSATRRQAPSPPTPPRRSPSEPSRRLEGAKVEKLRKRNCVVSEFEEGEVAPDPETKARPAAAEQRKQVESVRVKEKGAERAELKKVDSGLRLRGDLRTQGKGVTGASAADNLGKEERKSKGDVVAEAGKVTNTLHEKSALDVVEKRFREGHETASAVDQVGQITSSGLWQDEVVTRDHTASVADVVGQSTPSNILKEATQEEATTQDETANAVDKIGQGTSSGIRQEVLQEAVLTLDETANAVDVVGKRTSSSMLHEVLPEEVRDGNANVVGGVETSTSSSLLQGAMQEEVIIRDVAANIVHELGQVSSSGILQEVMHEVNMVVDGTANTINVVGRRTSSSMLEEAMHGNASAQEGTAKALEIAGKRNPSTMLLEEVREEVMTFPCQVGQEIKETDEGTTTDMKMGETTESVASQAVKEGFETNGCEKRVALHETEVAEEEATVEDEIAVKQVKHVDLDSIQVGANVFLQPTKDHINDIKEESMALNLVMGKPRAADKGKDIAFDVLNKVRNIGGGSSVGRGFDLGLQPNIDKKEASKSTSTTSVKQEEDTLKIGRLDLSLSLSGSLQNPEFKCSVSRPDSLAHHALCSQALPSSSSSSSSFRTNSDGLTASISLTSSQTFAHNPSCSLTQRSLDNCEHSVGSKPLFQGVDKVSSHTGWQAQLSSNESTQKREAAPLLQRVLQNGLLSDNNLVGANFQNNGISNDLQRRAGITGVLSPSHSHGSHDSGLEHSRHRMQLTRERSSSSLTRGERQHGEQSVLNGAGVVERVISKIVSEPLNHTGRMLQEMTGNSRTYLRESICEIIVDADKRGQVLASQEALKKRSDLNSEILQSCPRLLLEILVAIRTGLPDFIRKSSSIATSDLVDIFLNLKCRNLSCKSTLPVFDCDCKICQRKTGFCSSCMCIVCLKFDMASNTCSWVGCDVCLHWCHTDCGLHHSLIRKGGHGSREYCTNEMQFHCAACGHPSEMFGFVREVFQTCAKQWRMDILIRELQYVERIFSASDDVRGKRVRVFAKQMLTKLEDMAYYPDVVKYVTAFFSDDGSNLGSGPPVPLKGIPCSIAEGTDGVPSSSRKATWLPSVTLEGVPFLEKEGILSTTGSPSRSRKISETEFHAFNRKPVTDELDGLVRLKQAEANMYQERANDAHKEAESLKHIAMAKYAHAEEHYATQMAKLHINELQERHKQKIEELQVIERSHHQFLSMKTRMETNIRELLLKIEATKENLST